MLYKKYIGVLYWILRKIRAVGRPGTKWNVLELQFLEPKYSGMFTAKEIGKLIGRDWTAIRQMRYRRKIIDAEKR